VGSSPGIEHPQFANVRTRDRALAGRMDEDWRLARFDECQSSGCALRVDQLQEQTETGTPASGASTWVFFRMVDFSITRVMSASEQRLGPEWSRNLPRHRTAARLAKIS
jgi:hypothetical protein